ncbi:MAG: flagellar protein FlaG [Candidatus Omnitrophota bacterium]
MIENVVATGDNLVINKGEGVQPSPPPSPQKVQRSDSGPAVEVELNDTSTLDTAQDVNGTSQTASNVQSQTGSGEEEKLKQVIDSLNEKLSRLDREVEFKLDKRINKNYISVIDKQSKETIREFPPEEIRSFIARFDEINNKLMMTTDVKSLIINLEV